MTVLFGLTAMLSIKAPAGDTARDVKASILAILHNTQRAASVYMTVQFKWDLKLAENGLFGSLVFTSCRNVMQELWLIYRLEEVSSVLRM